MPIEFMIETVTGTGSGSTLFERMRRTDQMRAAVGGALVTVDIAAAPAFEAVRFERAEVGGRPGVVM